MLSKIVGTNKWNTWFSPKVLQVDISFNVLWIFNRQIMYISGQSWSFLLPQLLQMNSLHHLVMMTSWRHHIKAWWKSWSIIKKHIFGFIFLVPWKSTRNWNIVYGTSYSYEYCLPVDLTFSKWQERLQRRTTVWRTKNCHEWECQRAGEACYSRWPTYLNSGTNLNLLVLPFTWYNSPNYVWTQYENGVCKVGTPLPDRGTQKWRESEMCWKDTCHVWTARAQTTDRYCLRRCNFHV